MPLLDSNEMNYMPTPKYACGGELLNHSRAIGKNYGLYEKALLQTEVKSLRWREIKCSVGRDYRIEAIRSRLAL